MMVSVMSLPRVAARGAVAFGSGARLYHQDLTIKWKTGKPILGSGPYGLGRCVSAYEDAV